MTDKWVSAWAHCHNCGHEHATARPLIMDFAVSQCPACGQMTETDNGPRWTGPNPFLPPGYEAALTAKYGPKCCQQ